MREWLVIEKTAGRGVFASDEMRNSKGYFPRDVAESELGIKIEDGRCTFFSVQQSEAMRNHPAWRDNI